MNILKLLITNYIILLFTLSLYFIYLIHLKSTSKKENKNSLSISIISSLLLIITLGKIQTFTIFFTIPLLLSYLLKKTKPSIIISIVIVAYLYYLLRLNLINLIVEYSLYFIAYNILKNNQKFTKKYFIFFITTKLIFIKKFNLYILIELLIYLTTIYLFLKINESIKEIPSKEELEKEKNLKISLFKLNHELKNSLAVCKGYLDMMNLNNKSTTSKYLKIVKSEIKRTLTIINSFNEFGKIQKLEKEELDLSLLFEELNEILLPLYQEKNATIIIPKEEYYIKGDYNRLKQVFINILKNSLEAKNKDSLNIIINIQRKNNHYKISVKDNGKGMTKDDLDHIYDNFFTTKKNGTGIGIPYIKEIIELHQGSIEYKSKKNKGTIVTITLPI